jgi:tripartite-type tricarboxylate transporter receptor subunit TctC
VRLIVPFGAGGPTDILARVMAEFLSGRLGQPVVVESRPGAGGNIGTQYVINAPPDGYTLLVVAHTNAINASLYRNLPFNFLEGITPISGMVRIPNMMLVTPSLPVKSVPEFLAYAKANPGKVNFASTGIGTSAHLAGELFKSMTGVDMVHVPYRGSGPALADLMAGNVQLFFDLVPASIGHVKAGKLRVLAVTSTRPLEVLPGVPTVAETVPGFEMGGWFGIGAPRGTPQPIVERLNREINAGLQGPKVKARFADYSGIMMPGTAAEFRKFVEQETDRWAKVVEFSGARVD